MVFLSAMTIQRKSTEAILARCREAGVPVVGGGPLFTCEPQAFDHVDHLVLNEAELTLPLFLSDLAAGKPGHLYSTTEYPELSQTPAPLWELVDMRKYDAMSIQFSRGCPFNCDFCNVTALLGHRPRTKSAAQITAELNQLYALGWHKNVFFVDDNFIGNKKQIKAEILPALIEWRRNKTGVPFQTEASINLADDPELMRLMSEAGFDTVFVGIETPNEDSLVECSKNQNRGRDLVESVRRIQHAGMQVQGGFIVGFDNDSPLVFRQQLEFIQKSGIVTAMVGLLQAPYGTRLYERLFREGRVRPTASGDNVDGETNIIPRMPVEELRAGYRWLLDQLYAPRPFYARVRRFIEEYKLPRFRSPLEFQYVMAFFRSVYLLGIVGKERGEYWRLFFWTLFRRPSLVPLAITFAIYGYHFRKVCELHVR